ncbi:unnamed protein product [Euphydryas editha]|uniref:Uncharacterized protein n=1 Tax=Euphydryas editha TaxID=104508 RepID=A0AAU9USN4_EUPED|nr:unnamed protein product [Euphydryas editha]
MLTTTPRDETGTLLEIDPNIHFESTLKEQTTGCSSQPKTSKEKTDYTPDGENVENGTMPNVSPRASPSVRIVSPSGNTTQRNAPRATRRNNPRPSQFDIAIRYFAESDERWRLLIDRVATEHFRLRELELQQQAQWQALFERGMNVLEKGDKK